MTPNQETILAHVAKNPGATAHLLAIATGLSIGSVSKNLGVLAKSGEVERDEEGGWSATGDEPEGDEDEDGGTRGGFGRREGRAHRFEPRDGIKTMLPWMLVNPATGKKRSVEVPTTFPDLKKTKVCPKCGQRKHLADGFGLRIMLAVSEADDGTRTATHAVARPQSYCRKCRTPKGE